VTPRGTDWGLALLVIVGLATGLGTWFAGSSGSAWIVDAHAVGGTALALLLVIKLRRVWPRVAPRARLPIGAGRGLAAVALVLSVLLSGVVWSTAGNVGVAGFSVLVWHAALGAGLALAVLAHATLRARRPHAGDLGRRNLLTGAVLVGGALLAWQVQRPVQRLLGVPGARRRFTGSYEAGSFDAAAMPSYSWLDDSTPATDPDRWRLTVGDGRTTRELTLRDLSAFDTRVRATLDCTSGWYAEQDWAGVPLDALFPDAGDARSVYVHSATGYWIRFPVRDLGHLLLATTVNGEALRPGHGFPARIVAPGRRGFWWVKWVDRVELTTTPWWWQPPFPVT
jgi:DMSO/TMAO reductase YedYZ molybdopterin-dependent catalytic subunit